MKQTIYICLLGIILGFTCGVSAQDYRIQDPHPQFAGYTKTYPVFAGTYAEADLTSATVVTLSDIDTAVITYDDASTVTLIATDIWIQPSVNARYTCDNVTTPTATIGMYVAANDTVKLEANTAKWIKFIAISTTGKLKKQYFGWRWSYTADDWNN